MCHAPCCIDGVPDGKETDVDCGGGVCPGCALGRRCLLYGDCASLARDALALTCVADGCHDHRPDFGQTDVDCGGPGCARRCVIGQRCNRSADCVSGLSCNSGIPHLCILP